MRYTEVTKNLWRGPRPELEEFGWITKTFRTVISLEGPEEDAKETMDLKPARVVSCPISPWEIYFAGISQTKLNTILDPLIIYQLTQPVLIHCQHGEDRTGLVVAAFRVRYQGWTKENAWNEAIDHGYRHLINFGLNRTWRAFVK